MSTHRRTAGEAAAPTAPVEDMEEEVKPPKICRTVTVAVLLFLVGSLMLFFGVQSLGEAGGRERGISMCTVGAIAFLPGSYATWHLYGAYRRWPHYSYDMVPSYDE